MDDMTSIDAPAVRTMGVAVTRVGDRLTRAGAEIRGWEHAGDGAIEGSRTSESDLFGTALAWETTMAGLGARVTDFGAELRAAAGDFTATDVKAADRFLQTPGTPD